MMGLFDYLRRRQKENRKVERLRNRNVELAGKDYFTQQEAASYCCVSLRQFRKIAPEVGLLPFKFGGKLVYRRVDVQKALEDARWHPST